MKKLIFLLVVVSAALVGCGKDDDGGGGNPNQFGNGFCGPNNFGFNGTGNRYYSPSPNICIDSATNRQVNLNLCSQSGATQFNNGFNGYYGNGFNQFNGNCNGFNQFGNGFNQFGGFNGFNQFNVSSIECRHLDRPGFYYLLQVFPNTNTRVCVEYSTGFQAYPYGSPAFYPYPNIGFYGYLRF